MAKKKSAKKEQTKKSAKPKSLLATAIYNSLGISVLLVALSFAYLAALANPAANTDNVAAQAQRLADSQTALLDQALTQLRFRLIALSSNSAWTVALETGDQTSLDSFQGELSRAFPEAISAKLITLGPLGIASLDKDRYQLRNNIEQDLLRYASEGKQVEPEAYSFHSQWMFSLAVPIMSANERYASGALLVTLDGKYLSALLSQLDGSLGKTTLIQSFKRKEHIISATGTASDNAAVASDTSVSHWQIRFIPSTELVATTTRSPVIIWGLLALSVLTVAVASLLALSNIKKALASDLQKLQQPDRANQHFLLDGFAEVAKQLTAKASATRQRATAKQKAAAPTASKKHAVSDAEPAPVAASQSRYKLPQSLTESIFRAYDIRGLADQELNDDAVYGIAMAIGSEALDQGQQTIVVCADGRHSSPRIKEAMIKGLQASGRDVIDIGMLPTPLMYFATHQLGSQSGVMITGSHNPADYNGIKIVIGGRALSGNAITALRQRVLSNDLARGKGEYRVEEIEQTYIDYIINDVAIAQPLKVVIDAGNGVAGAIAPRLFEELGCEVIPLYCDVDGDFPNHHPDPSVEANLVDLKAAVKEHEADLGIAFDGDGDRLGVVTASGQSVAADRLLMLLAQDVVSRNPGADVLFDVKCTRNLNTLISNYGGRPIMWKTGHSFMKEKMVETGALLGGEFSGHIFFKERWFGFDDGMYAAARLIEILSTTDPDLDIHLEAFPDSISSPELKVETDDQTKFSIIEQLVDHSDFGEGKISTLDGLRVDYPDGWGLVRASNTTPMLILRFEADTEDAMARIQQTFKQQVSNVDNSLVFDF